MNVLIITYYWPPSGGPGVQRWLKFVNYLPLFCIDPIVLTVDPKYAEYPVLDPSLEADIYPDLRIYRTKCKGVYELYKKITGTKTGSVRTSISEKQLHDMAVLYLVDGKSYRDLEREVLKIKSEQRGGGFKAKSALNNIGIEAKHKSAVKENGYEHTLKYATDEYKKTLIELEANLRKRLSVVTP